MSAALKDAMMARMQGSAALQGLLAKDPNDRGVPKADLAIFPTRMNAVQAPVYPCITFREQSDVPDGRFRAQPAGAAQRAVGETYFDFESWVSGPSTRPLESIRDALDALFHQQAFAYASGSVFFCERLMGALDNYDDTLHVWYGLMRYRMRSQSAPGNVMPANLVLTTSGTLPRPTLLEATFYCDTTSGPQTQMLWPATGNFGQYTFVNVGTHDLTLQAAGTDTLSGAGSIVVAPGDRLTANDYAPGKFAIMSFRNTPNYQGRFPEVSLTATTTLTKPTQNTTYLVDTSAATVPVVITLYPSTGDNSKVEFIRTAGAQPVQFALAGSDSSPSILSNAALNNIGDVQPWAEYALNKWAAE